MRHKLSHGPDWRPGALADCPGRWVTGVTCQALAVRATEFRRLEPGFAVSEIVLARVLGEDRLKSGDDPPDVGLGAAVGSGHEDHAEMAVAAWHDRLVVQRPVITQVVGHARAVLGAGEGEDVGV